MTELWRTGNCGSLIYRVVKMNFAHYITSYKVKSVPDSETDFY